MKDEQTELLSLEQNLGVRVVGQDSALNAIAQRLRASKTGLAPENGPQGVFLLVGPSGTGKTETALALADELFGGEKSLITINLSEYQEPHTVSQLKGSPPGYVGYGQGGILTEAVRKRPYSVVLLDEVEKAHRDVMNLFYSLSSGICRYAITTIILQNGDRSVTIMPEQVIRGAEKGCVTMSITVPDSLSGARIFHLSMAPEAGWYIRRGHQSAKENILMTEDCFFKTIDCLA